MEATYFTGVMPPPPPEKITYGVPDYFKDLGYNVGSDYSLKRRECWWEIYKEGEQVIQFDKGVDLKYIIQDFVADHLNKKDLDSKVDYKISGPENKRFKDLKREIYEHCLVENE